MCEESKNNNGQEVMKEEYPSADVILKYTQDFYKLVSEDLNKLGVKTYTLLGFNGLLLRFIQGLPGKNPLMDSLPCYSCITLKIICCLLALSSIGFCIGGFLSGKVGQLPDPSDLVKLDVPNFPGGWSAIDANVTKMRLAKEISNTLDEFDITREKKSKTLNTAIYCFAASAVTIGLDIILETLLGRS